MIRGCPTAFEDRKNDWHGHTVQYGMRITRLPYRRKGRVIETGHGMRDTS